MSTRLLPALLGALVTGLLLAASASAAAPGNTTSPVVNGTARVGQTLNVSNGVWSGSPTSYTYQWQRCTSTASCNDIAGQTGQSYVIRNADSGYRLRAVVTAVNADGQSTADSNMTPFVPASGRPLSTSQPTVSGDAVVGGTLTADPGTWSNAPTSTAYQWLQCDRFGANCLQVDGATGKSYGVRLSDVYGTLRVAVTATNANGSTTRRSAPSDVVEPLQPETTPGNKAPTIAFLSLRRVGVRVYARFRVCDDAAKSVTVYERDEKTGALGYVRKFSVVPNSCIVATRSWVPAPRFRTRGRFVVTLRAVDKSRASSRFVSHSLSKR